MSSTADRRADTIRDGFLDRHGSDRHMAGQAAGEAQSLTLALGWVDIALAAVTHHQRQYCPLANIEDARIALVDARCEIETERAALGRVANIRSAA